MENIFKKHETTVVISLIVLYVVANSYIMNNFGLESIQGVIINTIISLSTIILIASIKGFREYGFIKPEKSKEFLYFIPLFIISLFNIYFGIAINNTKMEIIYHILAMINVGFMEEVIFRGFLFKMMAKDNIKSAIIVSSITFGIGHIVNLLNGAEIIPTLCQIGYAVAIGYMLVLIFYKSKSIIPCILFHILFNSLSIFVLDGNVIIGSVILIIMCLGYSLYINKKLGFNS